MAAAPAYKYMFKGNVHHDNLKFKKGDGCPAELVEQMLKIKAVVEVPVPVVPTKHEEEKKA